MSQRTSFEEQREAIEQLIAGRRILSNNGLAVALHDALFTLEKLREANDELFQEQPDTERVGDLLVELFVG